MNIFKNKILYLLICLALVFSLASCDKKYNLSFNVDGGDKIATISVKEGEEYTLPEATKEGYEFAGWYLTNDFSGESVTSVKLSGNTTVYAAWTKLYKINLNADGGACNTTFVYGKTGEKVNTLLNGITPLKDGLTFGAWFNGNTEVTDTYTVGTTDLNLTAKYKVEYKVVTNTEKTSLDGYTQSEATYKDYVGATVTPGKDPTGFDKVSKEDSVESIVLKADKTENNLNVYYNREKYTVTFNTNYPGTAKENATQTYDVYYGVEVDMPFINFTYDNYVLTGWATSATAKTVAYEANYVQELVQNTDDYEPELDTLNLTKDVSLYGVWSEGYADMFGGVDVVFVADDGETVYLNRCGVYFVGEYYGYDQTFYFLINEQNSLEGKVFDDGTFSYYNSERASYSATLYRVGVGLDENVKILFDEYNGITYVNKIEGGQQEVSKGTYTIVDGVYYVAFFEKGPLMGKELTLILGSVTLEDAKTDAFQLRNEEEYGYGEIYRLVVVDGNINYYPSAYQIKLSGFGTLTINLVTSTPSYSYTFDKETNLLTIKNSSGSTEAIAKIMPYGSVYGYMFYEAAFDNLYVFEGSQDTLALDGIGSGVYTKNNVEIKGTYAYIASVFGGKICTFTAEDKTVYTFILNAVTSSTTIGEEVVENVTYTAKLKLNTYQEFYYMDGQGAYYAPLIVLDDETASYATIYGYTTEKTYVKMLDGYYFFNDAKGVYVFTKENSYTNEAITSPFDISTLKTITFNVDTTSTNYAVSYWYDVTFVTDEKETYDVKYTSAGGDELTIVGSIALYKDASGNVTTGAFSTNSNTEVSQIKYVDGYYTKYLYFELDHELKTFVKLEYAPYSAYVVHEDGTYDANEYITFDGKGSATYVYPVTVGEEVTSEQVTGTIYTLVTKTIGDYTIYTFSSNDKTFNYIIYSTSSATLCLVASENFSGTYTNGNTTLELDGFGATAKYTLADETLYEGIYGLVDDSTIYMQHDNGYFYFDITNKTFTVKGQEYGTYLTFENQAAVGNYIYMDGYGHAEIFKYEKNGDEYDKVVIDGEATYTIVDGVMHIVYHDGAETVNLNGITGTYTYNTTTFRTFVVEHKEVVRTFVNKKDWSVLILDEYGNAIKTTNKGVSYTGQFKIITSSLLYFVNDAQTEANIYKFNMETGDLVASEFTARGYYTKDLYSLLFSQYGFAVFNNETTYYYAMEGNNVIIYHQDAENPDANEYGFVAENFGEFLPTKVYGGKTYYENDGYAINFTRVEATKNDYPVKVSETDATLYPLTDLVFTPSGSAEFTVTGTCKVNNKVYNCYVIRELDGEDYKMYVSIGYYIFDITCEFNGKDGQGNSNSTYEVIGMRYEHFYYPYAYLNTYYMLYSFLGATYASSYKNNLGIMYNIAKYNAAGEQLGDYITFDFLENTTAYDLNGDQLEIKECAYTAKDNVYYIDFVGADGYQYHAYIGLQYHQAFGLQAYRIYAITREETLTSGDYSVLVERYIYCDTTTTPGTVFSLKLKYNDEEVKYDYAYTVGDNEYKVVLRTVDETTQLVTSTKYLTVKFTAHTAGIEEESVVVQLFESVSVTEEVVPTYYDETTQAYCDICDGKVTILCLDGTTYIVSESSYDEATETYTVTASNKKKYSIKIVSGVMQITEIIE